MPISETQRYLKIAQQSAQRDLTEVRATLCRMQHQWSSLSHSLDGQTAALVSQVNDLERYILGLRIGGR